MSDRKKPTGQAELEEPILRYLELFAFAPEAYLLTDARGRIIEANEAAADLLQARAASLKGKLLAGFIEPRGRTAFQARLGRLGKENRIEDWEVDLKPPRKKAFPASITMTVFRGRRGRLEGMRWLIRDATRTKKQVEMAQLASFPELNPNPVIECDRSGRVHYINPGGKRTFPGLEKGGIPRPWRDKIGRAAEDLRRSKKKYATAEVIFSARSYDLAISPVDGGKRLRIYARDVTDQQKARADLIRAEEKLRKANEKLEGRFRARTETLNRTLRDLENERRRFQDVLNKLPAYIILLTPDYHCTFANRVFKETFGVAGDRRCFEFLFNRSEPCENCMTYKVLETGSSLEWEWTGPNGRHYQVFDFPFTDNDGSRLILEMGIDITERRSAEETVGRQAALYNDMLRATRDGFCLFDQEGRFVDVNDAYCRMTGYAREELLRMKIDEVEAEETPADVIRHIQAVTANGFDRFETRHRRKDGRLFDIEISSSYTPLTARFLTFVRDITETRKIEEERRRLAEAVEQTAEAIALSDPDDRVLYVNDAFLHLHGLRREETLGRRYEDLLGVELEDKSFGAGLREARARGETWKGRLSRKMGDGRQRELQVKISAVRDDSGRVINYAAIESDVTQERSLEIYIRQLQKLEALGTLAGGIAHDFNNILVPILLNTEMAQLELAEDSPVRRRMDTVLEATNRGRELVRQIIAYSRHKGRKRDPVDLALVVREALALLRSSLPENIVVRELLATEKPFILGDPTQMHQIVMNLGNNARDAMRSTGGEIEVRLDSIELDGGTAAANPDLRPGPYVKLTVSDTGEGMTEEVQDKAFDPFFTTKKPGEGSGMGLPVVLGIVRSHGGAVKIASEIGRGTRFEILLPRTEEAERPGPAGPQSLPRGEGRILFVDDEPIVVRTITPLLERLGYTVVSTSDPAAALDLFRADSDKFDLVITDQTMAPLTGDQLGREMLRIRPGLPILLCTGFSEIVQEDEAIARGMAGLILKPFSAGEIAAKIREVLKR